MKNKLIKFASKKVAVVKKYSPEIMVGVGVVGVVGTVVLACKSTLKVESILDDHQEKLNTIALTINDEAVNYTQEVAKQDKTQVTIQTGVALVKLYLPAACLGALSVASIVQGTRILKKRNVALTAAYGLVQSAYDEYRQRVRDDLGELKDREYAYGVKHEKIKHKTKDEDGKSVTNELIKEELTGTSILNGASPYARLFDESNINWQSNGDLNRFFVRTVEKYFNDVLPIRGTVFLNEVYDKLGFPRTQAGSIVGWVYGNKSEGDQYISFGYLDNDSGFINGYENTVLLDFNVDGVINEKLDSVV